MARKADSEWFLRLVKERYGSLRSFAPMMGMDHTELSRRFRGQRALTFEEAVELARLLKVSLDEMAKRMGF